MSKSKFTSFVKAAESNDLEKVQSLIMSGIDVNVVNENNDSALILASMAGHSEMVKLLLYHKANAYQVGHGGNTALSLAAMREHKEIIEQLFERGVNPDFYQVRLSVEPFSLVRSIGVDRVEMRDFIFRCQNYSKEWAGIFSNPQDASKSLESRMARITALTQLAETENQISGKALFNIGSGARSDSPAHLAAICSIATRDINLLQHVILMGGRMDNLNLSGQTPMRIILDLENAELRKFLSDAVIAITEKLKITDIIGEVVTTMPLAVSKIVADYLLGNSEAEDLKEKKNKKELYLKKDPSPKAPSPYSHSSIIAGWDSVFEDRQDSQEDRKYVAERIDEERGLLHREDSESEEVVGSENSVPELEVHAQIPPQVLELQPASDEIPVAAQAIAGASESKVATQIIESKTPATNAPQASASLPKVRKLNNNSSRCCAIL